MPGRPKTVALHAVIVSALLSGSANADFNPFGRKRERPPAPSARPRPSPARPARPVAKDDAGSDEARIARYRGLVLSRPGEPFPLQRLVELYRKRDGNLDALVKELEERAEDPKTRYAALIALAGVHREDGRIEAAERTLEKAIETKGDAPEALLGLARLLEAKNRRADAISRYQQALPLLDNAADQEAVLRSLMTLFLEVSDFDKAKEIHDKIVKRAGGSFFVRAEFGRELALRGHHERAEAEYRALVRAAAGDNRALAPALRDLGRELTAQKKHDEALDVLNRALGAAGNQSGLRREILDIIVVVYRAENRLPELIELLENEKAGDFDRLALLASLYEETGRIDDALTTYKRALRARPRDISTRLKVVQILEVQGDLDAATSEYEKLIRAAPHDPTFVFQLAETLIQRGDRKGALHKLERLEARSGGDEDTLAALVDFYERVDEPDRARKLLERLAGGRQQDPRHLIQLGDRYFREGDEEKAMRTWARIRQVIPNEARAQHTLGEVYLEHDRVDEALEAFERAAELEPDNKAHKKAYAAALERSATHASRTLQARHYQKALRTWEQLLNSAGDDENLAREARQHIVTIWSLQRQLADHVRPLERRLKATPPDLDAGRLLAEVYTRLRRHGQAVRVLERVTELAPGDVSSWLRLERSLVLDGDREGALEVLERLLKLNPQRAREYYQRMAQYAAELYRDDEAIRYAAAAVELSPDDAEGHRRLGEMYRHRQQPDRAIIEFRRAIAKNDRLFSVYFDLAEILTNRGEFDEADLLLRRVMRAAPDDEMVSRAVRLSMQLNLGRGTLETLERDLLPVSLGNPQRPVYRRLLVEVYGHLTLGLLHQTESSDPEVVRQAKSKLRELGERAVKPLLDALSDDRDSQQRIAVELLSHIRNKSAGAALFNYATGDADAALRTRAMIAVGALEDPGLLDKLRGVLGPESGAAANEADPVAVAAAWAVARMKSPRARPLLLDLIETPAPTIQALSAVGLGLVGTPADRQPLAALASDPTAGPLPHAAAAFALGQLGARDQADVLVSLADSGSNLSRGAALVALARLRSEDAASRIAKAMVSGDAELRSVAAGAALVLTTGDYRTEREALGVHDGHIDIRRLIGALAPAGYEPVEQARALARLGAPLTEAAPLAVRTSDDGARVVAEEILAGRRRGGFGELRSSGPGVDESTKASATEAVEGIVRAVVPPFVDLARHPSPELRILAVRVLSSRPEPEARERIIQALGDPSERVRHAALSEVETSDPDVLAVVASSLVTGDRFADRLRAATALGRMAASSRDARVVSALTRAATQDSHSLVREAAVSALSRVDPGGSQDVLRAISTGDAEVAVRRAAKRALEKRP